MKIAIKNTSAMKRVPSMPSLSKKLSRPNLAAMASMEPEMDSIDNTCQDTTERKSLMKRVTSMPRLSKKLSRPNLAAMASMEPEMDSLDNTCQDTTERKSLLKRVTSMPRLSKKLPSLNFYTMDSLDSTCQDTTGRISESSDFGPFGPLEADPSVRFDPETKISEEEVRALFNLWNDALGTLDPDQVASRYSSNPCLLPTVSDVPRTDYLSIKDYFVHFLEKKPKGKILESHVATGAGWCMDNGIYEFFMEATGGTVKARYSFVYTKEGGEWKISHHHSSQMPEEVLPKQDLSMFRNIVEEVVVAKQGPSLLPNRRADVLGFLLACFLVWLSSCHISIAV